MTEIVFTELAEYDLIDIEYYIHVTLCNPRSAVRIVNGIIHKIRKLVDFPMKYSYVPHPLLGKIKLRLAIYENYNIFYYYDRIEDKIHIIRILYNKADWRDILYTNYH